MIREHLFMNKNVKLVKNDGFILYGTIIDIDDKGLILANEQTQGWHAFTNIRELTMDE
jgi:biotin-(acetyl-CoA carboxylase) ligase